MLAFLLLISDEDDRDKINKIYKCFHSEMLKTARYMLREKANKNELAEDAVENAFLKLIKYIKKIDASNTNRLRAYVITVIRNECFNMLNEPPEPLSLINEYVDSSYTEEEFVNELHLKERYEHIINAIRNLDDRYRIPLYMKYVEEQSPEEIAEFTRTNVKTIYTRLRQGKKLLLEKIEEKEANLC